MSSGDQKHAKGKAEVGATAEGAGRIGCVCLYLGPDILCGGIVGIVVWLGDMGDEPKH